MVIYFIYIPIWLDLLLVGGAVENGQLTIYIPIWLDLLLGGIISSISNSIYLHSNMVIFIMIDKAKYITKDYLIYIPIWLDLLFIWI